MAPEFFGNTMGIICQRLGKQRFLAAKRGIDAARLKRQGRFDILKRGRMKPLAPEQVARIC